MARLPVIGQDNDSWGQTLNEFLLQSHNSDGTIKAGAINSQAMQNSSVGGAIVRNGSIGAAKLTAGGGVTGDVLTKDTTVSGGLTWTLPVANDDSRLSDQRVPIDGTVSTEKVIDGNITETKLSSDVQTKLNTVAPVTSVGGRTGNVTLTNADVGLGNVNNVKVTIAATPPDSPSIGDMWVDIST